MYSLATEMSQNFKGWENFPAILKEFDDDLREAATKNAQDFMTARMAVIFDKFKNVDASLVAEHISQLLTTATYLVSQREKLKFSNTPVPP
jgi:chitinase